MKNPFTPNLMRHIEALLRGSGYDEETIEYAAHAINQHEKLVGLLRVCDPILKAGVPASLRSEVRRELAALLKEEKPCK